MFRLTPADETKTADLQHRLERVAAALGLKDAVERRVVPRTKGKAAVVDVIAPLKHVLGDANSVQDVESRLLQFVEPLLRAVVS